MECVDRSAVLLWSLVYLGVCALVLVGMLVYAAALRRRRSHGRVVQGVYVGDRIPPERWDRERAARGPIGDNQNGEGE